LHYAGAGAANYHLPCYRPLAPLALFEEPFCLPATRNRPIHIVGEKAGDTCILSLPGDGCGVAPLSTAFCVGWPSLCQLAQLDPSTAATHLVQSAISPLPLDAGCVAARWSSHRCCSGYSQYLAAYKVHKDTQHHLHSNRSSRNIALC